METEKHPLLKRLGLIAGISLLSAFFLPIITPGGIFGGGKEISFLNFEVWTEDDMPFLLKFYLLLPLLLGILSLVAVFQKQHVARAMMFLVAGFAPIITVWLVLQMDLVPTGMGRWNKGIDFLNTGEGILGILIMVCYYLGLLGMVTAGFAGSIHRESRTIPKFAMLSGILMCLSMVIPAKVEYNDWTILLGTPFKAMADDPIPGIITFLFIMLHIVAAIVCILWGRNAEKGAHHAQSVRRLITAAYMSLIVILMVVLAIALVSSGYGHRAGIGFVFFTGTIYLKFGLMAIGYFYAKSLGMVELLAHRPPHHADPLG
jgi:hypothetical protein